MLKYKFFDYYRIRFHSCLDFRLLQSEVGIERTSTLLFLVNQQQCSRLCGITNVYGKYFRFRYIWFKLKNSWNTCSVNLIYFSIFFVYNLRRALSLHRHYHFFGKPIQHSVRHIWLNLQRLQIHPLLNILDLH